MLTRIMVAICLAAAAAAALAELPYGYYQLLRLAVCGGAVFLVFAEHQSEGRTVWLWALGALAVIFNPLIPLQLEREAWVIIDVAAALLFLGYAIALVVHNQRTAGAEPVLGPVKDALADRRAREEQRERDAAEAVKNARQAAAARAQQREFEGLLHHAQALGLNAENPDPRQVAKLLSWEAIRRLRDYSKRIKERSPDVRDARDGILMLLATHGAASRFELDGDDILLAALTEGAGRRTVDKFPGADAIAAIHAHIHTLNHSLIADSSTRSNLEEIWVRIVRWMVSGHDDHLHDAVSLLPDLERSIGRLGPRPLPALDWFPQSTGQEG